MNFLIIAGYHVIIFYSSTICHILNCVSVLETIWVDYIVSCYVDKVPTKQAATTCKRSAFHRGVAVSYKLPLNFKKILHTRKLTAGTCKSPV